MKKIIIAVFILAAVAAAAGLFAGPAGTADARPILITNAVLIPVSRRPDRTGADPHPGQQESPPWETNVAAPADAEVIDAEGRFVYPGFIDAYTHSVWWRFRPSGPRSTSRELGKKNPELKAVWGINPSSVHFGTSRINGTTAALVAPPSGEPSRGRRP
jgi:hypothetical protein